MTNTTSLVLQFTPILRQALLSEQQNSIASLEIRAIAQEKELSLRLPQLQQLTLDQGIHLQSLHVDCPSLSYLRIQVQAYHNNAILNPLMLKEFLGKLIYF